MSYAAPYPNCSTQYSKSFPLLTTRTHTPNQPHPPVVLADARTLPFPLPSPFRGEGRDGGANLPSSSPCPRGCGDPSHPPCCPRGCGDPSHPLLSSRRRGPIPPPVVLAKAGTHPTPCCPRGRGDPSHPLLSSQMRGPILPPLSSQMRGPILPPLSSRMRGPIPLPLPSRPACPMAPPPSKMRLS